MSFSTLCIEPLTTATLPAAVELDRACLGGLWSLEGYQREIDSPNSELLILRMQTSEDTSGTVIGLACLWCIVDEAHITLLAVHPDYQRRGLGQLLLRSLLHQAVQRQMARATLEVRASNQGAIALYTQFGFEQAGRRRGYYPATGEDALIFWRPGLQTPEFALELSVWSTKITQRLQQHNWQLNEVSGQDPKF